MEEAHSGQRGWRSGRSNPASRRFPTTRPVIDAVTVPDLQRMVETYYTPERRFAGLHHPIVTVPRSARLLGVMAGVGTVVWLGRKLLRR